MPLTAALTFVALVVGIAMLVAGLRPVPVGAAPVRSTAVGRLAARWVAPTPDPVLRRRRLLLLGSVIAGVLAWLFTGWLITLLVFPAAALGLPALLKPVAAAASIEQLEAMEEWTRNLSGVLTVGVGLEQAMAVSLGSTPDIIRPQVATLVARLRARWDTEAALRAFADELGDATGDVIAGSLILGARRRGPQLASVLEGMASTVAEEVRIRRAIEADRARPRTTARGVTLVTLVMGVLLFLNKDYVAPYGTAMGQIMLAVLLCAYAGALVWMRQMTRGRPTPRFLPKSAPPSAGPAA